MAKTLKNFRLSDPAIEALKLLAEKHVRSEASMLEFLIIEAAKRDKLIK